MKEIMQTNLKVVDKMDLMITNTIMNPKQENAVLQYPEMVESLNIDPATGKVYIIHNFFIEPFYIGTLPAPILPILSIIKFSVKSWKFEGKNIFLTINIDPPQNPEILKTN